MRTLSLRQMIQGQIDRIGVGITHLLTDRPSNYVARGQLSAVIELVGESVALLVNQVSSLATHGFRDKETGSSRLGECGGVKLKELAIDRLGAGSESDRHAVGSRDFGIGSFGVELAGATAGQDDASAVELSSVPRMPIYAIQSNGTATVDKDRCDLLMLDNIDIGGMEDPGGERSLDAGAGRVAAGMEDPWHAVGTLAGESDLPVVGIESNSKRYEVDHTLWAFFAEDAYRVRVAETGAGGDCVLVVKVGGVLVTNGGGYTALGPKGIAVLEGRFGEDQNAAVFLSN